MISDREIEREQARAEEALERRDQKMEERCGNCRFYDVGWGQCVRNPPVMFPALAEKDDFPLQTGFWPEVEEHFWCGEWKPAKEEPKDG